MEKKKILNEIYKTEKSYLHHLVLLKTVSSIIFNIFNPLELILWHSKFSSTSSSLAEWLLLNKLYWKYNNLVKNLQFWWVSHLIWINISLIHYFTFSSNFFHAQLFLEPLKISSVLPARHIDGIFSNIEAIHQVSAHLLELMESEGVIHALLNLAPYLKLYSLYANNFNTSNKLLEVHLK